MFQVQAALDAALQDEEDLHLDAGADKFTKRNRTRLVGMHEGYMNSSNHVT